MLSPSPVNADSEKAADSGINHPSESWRHEVSFKAGLLLPAFFEIYYFSTGRDGHDVDRNIFCNDKL